MSDAGLKAGTVRARSLIRVVAVGGGLYALAAVVLGAGDHLPRYACGAQPPPAEADAAADYLPGALAVVTAGGCVLAWVAWRWWRNLERPLAGRSPAQLIALGLPVVAWAAIVGTALIGDHPGAGPYWGLLLGLVSLVILGLLLVALLLQLFFVKPSSINWEARADALTALIAWVTLLGVYPWIVELVSLAGRGVTGFC